MNLSHSEKCKASDEWYDGLLQIIIERFNTLLKKPSETTGILGPVPEGVEECPEILPVLFEILNRLGVRWPAVPGVERLQIQVLSDFYLWMKKERPDVLSGILHPYKISK